MTRNEWLRKGKATKVITISEDDGEIHIRTHMISKYSYVQQQRRLIVRFYYSAASG